MWIARRQECKFRMSMDFDKRDWMGGKWNEDQSYYMLQNKQSFAFPCPFYNTPV